MDSFGKELFPTGFYSKLFLLVDGPFHIVEHINDIAYKLKLSGEYRVSATFNVADFPHIMVMKLIKT